MVVSARGRRADVIVSAWLQGVGIGFAIAAPVGPIGLLCIRRTLRNGAAIGLATGLGAAAADTMYGLAVAGGLAITGWLVEHTRLVSGVGAVLLLWLGAGLLRSFVVGGRAVRGATPTDAEARTGAGPTATPVEAVSRLGAFVSTFALTAANPATILSFVGVIAALGGGAAASSADAFALVVGVFVGSALWWCLLVALVRHAGRWVTPTALRWIDLVTGLLLAGLGLWIGVRALAMAD